MTASKPGNDSDNENESGETITLVCSDCGLSGEVPEWWHNYSTFQCKECGAINDIKEAIQQTEK